MNTQEIERLIRANSNGHSEASLNAWLNHTTLTRFQQWVPVPTCGQLRLLDLGFYQPTLGYYAALGWREVIGVAKEEGECNFGNSCHTFGKATARSFILDVEFERIPEQDESVDAALMMEIFEHFAVDPMHALAEVNRVLKLGGILVLSTPNAAAFGSLRRLIQGRGPFSGLEFSGFSTNRHNRIYDADELRLVMEAAGFDVELCTSQSFCSDRLGWRMTFFNTFLRFIDELAWLRTRRQIERGDYLFFRARKRGPVVERYPSVLYFDQTEWPDWYASLKREAASNR